MYNNLSDLAEKAKNGMDIVEGTAKAGNIVKGFFTSILSGRAEKEARNDAVRKHEKAKILRDRMAELGIENDCTASGGT